MSEEELFGDIFGSDTDNSSNDSEDDIPEEAMEFSEEELQAMTEELCDDAEQMLKKLEEEMAMEEQMEAMSEFISPFMSEEDVDELRKKHRAKEMLEITKADMKYLKAMFDKYQRERSEAAGSAAYSSKGSSSAPSCSGMHISVSVSSSSCDSPPSEGAAIDVSM